MRPLQALLLILALSLFSFTTVVNAQCDIDTIPPTVLVVNLSTAVVPESNQVELYAIDFFIFASDNCVPTDSLRYTFGPTKPEDDYHYIEAFRSSSMLYDCYDVVNSPVLIDLYAWDLAGNLVHENVFLTLVTAYGEGCEACNVDTIPPVVQMVESLVWPFPENSDSVEIWASDFILSASDQCTATDLIAYSFMPISPNEDPQSAFKFFDCYDVINSPFSVEIYAWDRDGNYTMGTSILGLQTPNENGCTEAFQDIKGEVMNLKKEPIEGAIVYLKRESGEMLDSSITNTLGEYTFYTNTFNKYLSVQYSDDSHPDVSVLDMVAIRQHLLGLNPFSVPQRLAADINADDRLRVNDLKMIRKLILGIINPDDYISREWQFVSQDYDINGNTEIDRNHIPLDGTEGPTIVGYRTGDVK